MKTWMIVVLAVFVLAGFTYLGGLLSGAPAARDSSVTPPGETSQTELSTTPSSSSIPTTSTSEPEQTLPTTTSQESEPAPSIPQAEPETFEPITISGSGDKTSPPFKVTTDEWVISWSYETDDPEYAVFGFFVYPRGETMMYVESALFVEPRGSTYSYAGAGEYYIKVSAGNVKSWKIVISPPQ